MTKITGQDLLSLRERLRLTQEEMAKHLGVAREWLSKLENGKQQVSGEVTLRYYGMLREFGFTGVVMDTDDDIRDPHPVGRHQGPTLPQPDPSDPPIRPAPKNPHAEAARQEEAARAAKAGARPNAERTRDDCMRYLDAYLRKAEGVPGAVARAYLQLRLHLPLWELDRLSQEEAQRDLDTLLRAADDAAFAQQRAAHEAESSREQHHGT